MWKIKSVPDKNEEVENIVILLKVLAIIRVFIINIAICKNHANTALCNILYKNYQKVYEKDFSVLMELIVMILF
jgi:hypothetical protein